MSQESNPERITRSPIYQLSREALMDLLTTAACIGRYDAEDVATRGDMTAKLETYPLLRGLTTVDDRH